MAAEVGDALHQFHTERSLGVAVMVEVDFHFRAGRAAQLGDVTEQVGIVLLDGVEAGVARADAVGVAEGGDVFWKLGFPLRHAAAGLGFVRTMERLEVVADAQKNIFHAVGLRRGLLAEIRRQPEREGAELLRHRGEELKVES